MVVKYLNIDYYLMWIELYFYIDKLFYGILYIFGLKFFCYKIGRDIISLVIIRYMVKGMLLIVLLILVKIVLFIIIGKVLD